ncbi:radical SAM protein [Verrucomicrobia bacterium LW23]|nr:radical SAM protein [Verrucomicrobia bacterium LW23]
MKAALNRMHYPVTTLGYGRRVGLWLQGCSIRCPGCVSQDTWEAGNALQHIDVEEIARVWQRWLPAADGLTISGGEPFDQPEALLALMRAWRRDDTRGGDILVFSGYPLETLRARHRTHLRALDVLISDPYEAGAGDTRMLRGSDNQRVTLATALARRRYPRDINTLPWSDGRRRLDMVVAGDDVWMAGIPRRGELARLQAALRERGLTCATSQQPRQSSQPQQPQKLQEQPQLLPVRA